MPFKLNGMDELDIDGVKYISARSAARTHGYTSDYIGQLIRSGKLQGKKVGRAWHVEKNSLAAYVSASSTTSPPAPLSTPPSSRMDGERKIVLHSEARVQGTDRTYPLLTYIKDEEPILPPLKTREEEKEERETIAAPSLPIVRKVYIPPRKSKERREPRVSAPRRQQHLSPVMGLAVALSFALVLTGGSVTLISHTIVFDESSGTSSSFSLQAPKFDLEQMASVIAAFVSREAE